MSAQSEGLITIAYGPPKYIRMAIGLSLSYKRHNPSRPIAIVTDERNLRAVKPYFDTVIEMKPEWGPGVVQKLHLDAYSPFAKTLFVDSDCLFYRNPEELWLLYAHGHFSVRGWRYLTGETEYEKQTPYRWVNDTSEFLKLNGITRLAHFNSGVLYFDRSDAATRLFQTARTLYEHRTRLGFAPFKGAPINDEPALAAAMELCGIEMDPWDSTRGMETAIGMKQSKGIHVLKGNSRFVKSRIQRNPVLIHFNVNAQDGFLYNRDLYRLLYEKIPHHSLLLWRSLFATCIPAYCKRARTLLSTAGRGPGSRGRRGRPVVRLPGLSTNP